MGAHLYYQDQGHITRLTREAGFGWLKQQVRWSDVEKTKGQPDWSELDKIVDFSLKAPVNVMFSVVSSPTWSRAAGGVDGPPDNLADFAVFMSQLATRYKGQVRAYEIWNEQNFSREWGGGQINAGAYVELLKVGYEAVKAADPNAIVVSGALTPTGFTDPNVAIDDVLYMEQMYQYKEGMIKQYADVVGAHAGGFNNPPEADPNSASTEQFRGHPSFYFRRVEQLRSVMEKYGDGGKRMWLTEFGWSTANLAPGYEYGRFNTEQNQADYLVRAYNLAKTRYPWMGVMFVWNLNFATLPDLPPTDEKPPFGILNKDWTPRPAYNALKAMPK
jgi:polysaccharide biosynthesis protein PslG